MCDFKRAIEQSRGSDVTKKLLKAGVNMVAKTKVHDDQAQPRE